jgi:hypothetical protein
MQNSQPPLKVLNGWHHLAETLHLGEDINKWLVVIKSLENLVGKGFLDVVYSLLLSGSCSLNWIFSCF